MSSQLRRSSSELAAVNLDLNLKQFKKFNANRKFKAGAKAVMAVRKLHKLLGSTNKADVVVVASGAKSAGGREESSGADWGIDWGVGNSDA